MIWQNVGSISSAGKIKSLGSNLGLQLYKMVEPKGAAQVCYVFLVGGAPVQITATSGFYHKLVFPKLSALAGSSRGFQRPAYDKSDLDKLVLTFQWSHKENFFLFSPIWVLKFFEKEINQAVEDKNGSLTADNGWDGNTGKCAKNKNNLWVYRLAWT